MHKKSRRPNQVRHDHRRIRHTNGKRYHSDLLQANEMRGLALFPPSQEMPQGWNTPETLATSVPTRIPLRRLSENTCLVCGFEMRYAAKDNNICICCGTEFGYDDDHLSYSDLRIEWIENGAGWWDDDISRRPLNWSASTQVISAFGQTAWDSAVDKIQSEKLRQRFGDGNAATFVMHSRTTGLNQCAPRIHHGN
jgi:hypothetical protein